MKYQVIIAICIILAILLGGCAAPPRCAPLPEMGEAQSLTDYTVSIVNLYNVCRGVANATR